MSILNRIRSRTQATLDMFCGEHYAAVYAGALALTGSPEEAHALTIRAFQIAGRRFIKKPDQLNCDLYLLAQVQLLYAQQAATAPVTAQPRTAPAKLPREKASVNSVPPVTVQTPEAAVPTSAQSNPATATANVPARTADARGDEPAAPITQTTGVFTHAASPADQAVTEASNPALTAQIPQPQGPVAQAIVFDSSAPIGTSFEPAQAATTAVAATQAVGMVGANPEACYHAVFNPDDTEFWSPETAACHLPPQLSEPSAWLEEDIGRPSAFLSILNGVLVLGAIASIAFLLWQLGILPKIF